MKMRPPGLVLALALFLGSTMAQAYYGPFSTEAWLRFDAYVDAPMVETPDLTALNQAGGAEHDQAVAAVKKQVRHLIGVFQSATFKREFGYVGTLDEDSQEVVFTSVESTSESGRARLNYSFRGKAVFDNRLFAGGKHDALVPFLKLPREPDRIYKLSTGSDGKNHCTDAYWNDEYDFYYFFDPDKFRCPLRENYTDVLRVSGSLSELPNTTTTYPRYDRLYAGGTDGVLHAALFYGYISQVNPDRVNTKDPAYRNFRRFESELAASGFVLDGARSLDRFRLGRDGEITTGIDFLHYWRSASGNTEIQILVSDTDSESKDGTFHSYFKSAIEGADLVDYDGHVGTPENLDLRLPAFRDVRLDPARYQIFFFNGCSTYPYFKQMYFAAKGGSSNLSVITSGIEEDAMTTGDTDLAFLKGFFERRTESFQSILADIEGAVGPSGPYFFGVSGDEESGP